MNSNKLYNNRSNRRINGGYFFVPEIICIYNAEVCMKAGASTMRRRIFCAMCLLAAVFVALFGRLFYLQVIDGG